ncbi:MAG: MaoC/PaaZ C-terminal domain-containing protein [Alphaproteobacteria bacterium]
MSIEPKTIGEMTREKIVRYAGVIQDFNPIHYDDAFAQKAGLPSVVAHGPLTMLFALDALIASEGLNSLSGFQVRLKAPVVPGAKLRIARTADGEVTLLAGETEALAGRYTKRG